MKQFLLQYRFVGGTLRDMSAAVSLIKEAGGRLLHLAPIVGGWVVECSQETGDDLGLMGWE